MSAVVPSVSVRRCATKKQGLKSFCFLFTFMYMYFFPSGGVRTTRFLDSLISLVSPRTEDETCVFIAQGDHQLWFRKRIKHVPCFFVLCCENNQQQTQQIPNKFTKNTTATWPTKQIPGGSERGMIQAVVFFLFFSFFGRSCNAFVAKAPA